MADWSEWGPCVLTWYQPSRGGINADSDPTDYANGDKVREATDMVCAAPAGIPFGTKIRFRYRGKVVTCTVKDRGGDINGNRFDLMPLPARRLGIVRAGRVDAEFSFNAKSTVGWDKGSGVPVIGGAIDAVSGAVDATGSLVGSATEVLAFIGDSGNWLRVGKIVGGGMLITAAGVYMLRAVAGQQIVKGLVK